jgi:hypothetical protein
MRYKEEFIINLIKQVIKYFIVFNFISSILIAQEIQNNRNNVINNNAPPEQNNNTSILKNSSFSIEQNFSNPDIRNPILFMDPVSRFGFLKEKVIESDKILIVSPANNNLNSKLKNKIKQAFNIISSFRENIRFGGFWDKYAIINFTPSVNIKPFDFISINANQNLSCFIPVQGIKEHFKSLCIQGAALLAVDNSIKLLFGANRIIPSVAGYAAKNIIISLLRRMIEKKSNNQVYSYNSYNYSVNIRF